MGFSNLILDLGGVILNVDYTKIVDKFRSYGIKDFQNVYTQAAQSSIIDRFEEGTVTISDFRNGIRDLVKTNLTDEQIDEAWMAMILDLPKENVELLGLLKLKYNLYLFSNTNELHIEFLKRDFERQCGFDVFTCCFNKAYFSNEIHLRKPDPKSFLYILDDANLSPADTLFIDDSPQHLEGAKQVGLQTYWLTNGEKLTDLLNNVI
ncbi:MAG: HAD-IA family hydrolase [Bacteroidales bacterium]|jgi:putative hydrolase of the HAD superfamily|nr:HAD-IA family hydrolase [Bacteroidales bacterium]